MKTIQTTREHYNKYKNIVDKKGNLNHAIPATKDEIIKAIESGDIHLNTIPINKWDARAQMAGATNWVEGKAYKSLSEQVCTLKHYAIYNLAGYKPEFTD